MTFSERLRYGGEAAIFFAFMALFRFLPLDSASALGGWIGRHIFSLLPPDGVARANLLASFPEKTDAERDTIRMAMWDNLGRVVAEYPHLEKFTLGGDNPRIAFTFHEDVAPESAKERGLLFLSGHFANWEILPIAAYQLGYAGASVIRPPNNPFVARYIARQRGLIGPKIQIAKHSAARRMFSQLREGKALYILVDQKNNEGLRVPFFGRDAMTTPAPAMMALKLGARIIFASNNRTDGAHFHITVHPGPDFTPSGDNARDFQALTEIITARIEDMVRANPAQWLWIHRRWPTAKDLPRIS